MTTVVEPGGLPAPIGDEDTLRKALEEALRAVPHLSEADKAEVLAAAEGNRLPPVDEDRAPNVLGEDDAEDNANSIVLGAFDADKFGVINFPSADRSIFRFKLWLYVDGTPIYHPEVFTGQNPIGVELGGRWTPLPRPEKTTETS